MFKFNLGLSPVALNNLFVRNSNNHIYFFGKMIFIVIEQKKYKQMLYTTYTGSARHLETWNTPGYLFGIFQDLENLEK